MLYIQATYKRISIYTNTNWLDILKENNIEKFISQKK